MSPKCPMRRRIKSEHLSILVVPNYRHYLHRPSAPAYQGEPDSGRPFKLLTQLDALGVFTSNRHEFVPCRHGNPMQIVRPDDPIIRGSG